MARMFAAPYKTKFNCFYPRITKRRNLEMRNGIEAGYRLLSSFYIVSAACVCDQFYKKKVRSPVIQSFSENRLLNRIKFFISLISRYITNLYHFLQYIYYLNRAIFRLFIMYYYAHKIYIFYKYYYIYKVHIIYYYIYKIYIFYYLLYFLLLFSSHEL